MDAASPPTVRAIPTEYGGCNFRSRLEARWAAFFDIVGWSWDYEPIDFNGWCPDFSLQGHHGLIYVEVKPAEWLNRRNNSISLDHAHFGKVFSNGPKSSDILLLGIGPVIKEEKFYIGSCNSPSYEIDIAIGSIEHRNWDSSEESNFDNAVAQFAHREIKFGYCHESGWFADRITGFHDKGGGWQVGEDGPLYWRQAGSAVQWKGTRQ